MYDLIAENFGKQFALNVAGFAPNEYVDLTNSSSYSGAPFPDSWSLQADANGAISTTLVAAAGLGRQDLKAKGRSSAIELSTAACVFIG